MINAHNKVQMFFNMKHLILKQMSTVLDSHHIRINMTKYMNPAGIPFTLPREAINMEADTLMVRASPEHPGHLDVTGETVKTVKMAAMVSKVTLELQGIKVKREIEEISDRKVYEDQQVARKVKRASKVYVGFKANRASKDRREFKVNKVNEVNRAHPGLKEFKDA